MNIICDNYSVCNSILFDKTEEQARVKGWHIWTGFTIGGKKATRTLCARCVDSKRRDLAPSPEAYDGQLNLFELRVIVGPEPKIPLRERVQDAWFNTKLNLLSRLKRV